MLLLAWLAVAFIIGATVGSFLNVAVYRLPRALSPLWPPSSCGSCHARIRLYDNVPIVSYLVLRGRCRDCRSPYSPRYLLLEALTGFAFAAVIRSPAVLYGALLLATNPHSTVATSDTGSKSLTMSHGILA